MTSHPHILFASALALALGGCMGTENRGIESVHQPVVDRADYAIDLATAGGGLAVGEQARLSGWLEAMRLGYGDRVAVDNADGANVDARAEVGGIVAGYGLMLAEEAPVTASAIAPGAVRVVVSRMRAYVPGCPDWSRDVSTDVDSHTSSNYGCATNTNLAAMVANPSDLVGGRTGPVVNDPVTSTKAIVTYRNRTQTGTGGLQAESTGGEKK